MITGLQILLAAIVPMLAYWAGWDAGWRARGWDLLQWALATKKRQAAIPTAPDHPRTAKPQFPSPRIIREDFLP